MKKNLLFLILSFPPFLHAQTMAERYCNADRFSEKFDSLYFGNILQSAAIDSTHAFWYLTRTPQGRQFVIVDADKKEKRAAFDHQRLADSLNSRLKQTDIKAGNLPFSSIRLGKSQDKISFTVKNEFYTCRLSDYSVEKTENPDRRRRTGEEYWGTVFREDGKIPVPSPDGKREAYISEGNLWIRNRDSAGAKQLSLDGSPSDYYSSTICWSPDSRKIVCCRYRPVVSTRRLTLIESSPKDRLQPKISAVDYPKPGDALPIRRPVWFDVEKETQHTVAVPDLENQFSLENIQWNPASSRFYFSLNKRGHQEYTVYATDVTTGKTITLVHETSPTFIYYNRLYQYRMEDRSEMLWISERDGWQHLYLYDLKTGSVKRQLTRGEWVFKSVVHIDEQKRTLIFKACGMDKNEDPYLEKYYSLNIDSGKITPLTPENATHTALFTSDFTYLLDVYSRVDLPPTAVLRSAADGKILLPLEKADISRMTAAGWRMPEVFSAKGRDGETDIWGMIIRPTGFDPARKYPVIEYIYAGPHDSHVPKSFAVAHRPSALGELGFITVTVDGAGTANRSKAFHDVCWKNLKDAGLPDHIAWLKAAAAQYPELDIGKTGIYGSSAGGQSSTGAVLFHPEFYKVAVSSCGCHDNRMDKIWWNEQWMGYPVDKSYEESSNVCNAEKLQGKLMLLVGELDDNVDPSSTLQLADALIRHNKEFELVMLPGAKHTLGGDYGERKRRDFFVKHLLKTETPEWNAAGK
ncbi:MAG: S9 family peptidase [Bacteroidales bacterium]|jgi:dipeptidyl aminopeptidase/acylaminoacyl peptidase|nr:S9 family peptidase [Bacteroidales bacterium]